MILWCILGIYCLGGSNGNYVSLLVPEQIQDFLQHIILQLASLVQHMLSFHYFLKLLEIISWGYEVLHISLWGHLIRFLLLEHIRLKTEFSHSISSHHMVKCHNNAPFIASVCTETSKLKENCGWVRTHRPCKHCTKLFPQASEYDWVFGDWM